MTELEPCPFCGGKAEIHPSNDWDMRLTGATYFAWCGKCETRGDYYSTEIEAAEAWNKRAERTCEYVGDEISGGCSECRGWLDPACAYCPTCGAKVVEE